MSKNLLISIICLICFVIITLLVTTEHIEAFDELLYGIIHEIHNSPIDFFFIHFTHIGDTIPTICIAIVLLLIFSKWKDRVLLSVSLGTTVAVNQILKHWIARPRPPLERRLIKQGGYSYPSGHSMVSLCVYGVLMYFVSTKVKNKKIKVAIMTLLTLIILLIGISRIYVGVHYPSDVLGGYLLSITILLIVIPLINYHFEGECKNDKNASK